MAGKTKKQHRIVGPKEKNDLINKVGGFSHMNYKDLQRRAIILGMPFPDVPQSDFFKLQSFIARSTNKPDTSLVDKYDDWMDKVLEDLGHPKDDPIRSYQLRLGYVSEDARTKQKKTKKIHGLPKQKKPKKEKDERGLWKGTKKSYVYELVSKGFELERVTRRVLKKFPEANEKSIKQWYRAAKRKIEGNK